MTGDRGMRVAIACSGLGHVQRGIEAWSNDLAGGLRKAGIDVTLFSGVPADTAVGLVCLKRTGPANRLLTGVFRHLGGWRYGAGSTYEIEQTSFSLALWLRIRRSFDILHVQDPVIARWFEAAHDRGISRPKVIYANGTGEDGTVMRRFRRLQLLTRGARDDWSRHRPEGQSVFTIPNFVDTAVFSPGGQDRARARFNLPQDRIIVLCCAAIRRYHKRIDMLLTEFAAIRDPNVMLVVAGGRESDTDEIIAHGTALLGDRVRFLPDVPRANMPDLYRSADMFALASLHEMFGIVLVEAMASGLPVVCHDAPNFRVIVGPAGEFHDVSVTGGLAAGMTALLDRGVREGLAARARAHTEKSFSETATIPAVIEMYRSVMKTSL